MTATPKSPLRTTARVMLETYQEITRREALTLAAVIPRSRRGEIDDDCLYRIGDRQLPLIILRGYVADDGNAAVDYPDADSAEEAAEEYVAGGEFGSGGSIDVSAWQRAYLLEDGRVSEHRHEQTEHTIDVPEDHHAVIGGVMGRAGCGRSPEDHDWTSEGEGGLRENPGVWSLGGTTIVAHDHCSRCGLRRSTRHAGSQRNPGEAAETTTYSAPEESAE